MRILKKIGRFFIYAIVGFIAIGIFSFAILHIPYVQTKLTNFTAQRLTESTNLRVHVDGVSFSFWNTIVLQGVHMYDQQNKPIIESEKLYLAIHSFSRNKKQIIIEKISLSSTNIHLEKNEQGTWNIQSLLTTKKSNTPWQIEVLSIEIYDSNLFYKNKQKYTPKSFGINFSDIEIHDFNITASNLHLFKNKIIADIQGLSGKEKSGFILNTLSTELVIDSTHMNFTNIQIYTPLSDIHAHELQFSFREFKDFSNFIHSVSIQSSFQRSKLQFSDISYFAPKLESSPYSFRFSGNFKGRVSDFKSKDLHIEYGESSVFDGNVELMGLPNISETFIHIQTQQFSTNIHDIQNIRIPPYTENKYIQVPQILHDINAFSYTGNITGFIQDIVAYGTFTTEAGVIQSDISIKESAFKPNELIFSGDLSFSQFDLQKIAHGAHDWGKTTLSVKIKGDMTNGKFNKAFVRGDIANIEFKGYNYKQVSIDGLISKQRFDGQLEILDTNLTVNFSGLFDYSLEVPEFNFHANLSHANLHELGFVEDSIASLSLETNVDFIGLSLDNLKGDIIINRGIYKNSFGTYESKQFDIDVDNVGEHRNIHINSDLLDVTVTGKGLYQELQDYVYDFLRFHIPSIPERKNYSPHTKTPHFNISIHIKKADSLLHVLYPNIHIAQGSYINSIFSEEQQVFILESYFPEFTIGATRLEKVSVSTQGSAEQIETNCTYNLPLEHFTVPNITSSVILKNNSFEHSSNWIYNDTVLYKGNITNKGIFEASSHAFLPKTVFSIPHQTIIIADSIWNVQIANMVLDSSSIHISNAYLQKGQEKIEIEGTISHNPNDTISARFKDYDIKNLNYLIPSKYIEFSGILQGKVNIQSVYSTPLIFANISSNNFYFNGHHQGMLKIHSAWLADIKGISLGVSCTKGLTDILSLQGVYVPSSKEIDFSINLKNYLLSDFQEIFQTTVEDLSGYIDAQIQLNGFSYNPNLVGSAEIKRGKFKVLYTQTPYNVKGTVKTMGSRFVFSDISITDTLGNNANTKGFVDVKNLRNPEYEISLETNKLLALHTNKYDNQFFYGQAFFQGKTKIRGDLKNTNIQVIGKTLENTICNIPLAYSELEDNHDFLFFGNNETNTITRKSNSEQITGTEISLNLQVTPQALGQIIFDEKVGDIIRVRGNADLQIHMNALGDLKMNGIYTIDEGDYLFTLKSLINKKFIIQRGGQIQWTGDPLDARINVLADYKLKASPKPIMSTFENSDAYSKRINVTCRIHLENELMKPDISYTILLPGTSGTISEVIDNFSEDEKNIQFISLLLANSFINSQSQDPTGTGGLNTSSFEALTAQMNQILSQIDEDVDVGLNYRPGTEFTSNELELALSTQILNNRVLINLNGYTEFGQSNGEETATNTNEFNGDISIEVKLNDEGNIRLKGFSRSNNDPLNEKEGNTQGVGLFYSREFNYFKELFSKKNN